MGCKLNLFSGAIDILEIKLITKGPSVSLPVSPVIAASPHELNKWIKPTYLPGRSYYKVGP